VFQIRSVRENGQGLEPVIVSHAGRALQPEQESRDGKYWSYPFRKGWELYNQDLILLDEEARRQAARFGLIVTEGFFDVAKLVEADCRNAVALMGSTISEEQAERLVWLRARVGFPRLVLFLDRDAAGQKGMAQVRERLRRHDLVVTIFDWEQKVSWNGREPERIPDSIQDPADLGVEQLRTLRRQAIL
jgi:DNA primase